jgi:protein phosphatase
MDPRIPTALTPSLHWFGWTDRGKVRPNNEDSFLGLQFDSREVHYLGKIGETSLHQADLAFAVSDGMGGANAGEFASRVAVQKITDLLPRSFRQAAIGFGTGFDDILSELYDRIHRALIHHGSSYPECSGMEATLTLAWFTPGWMYFAHIGDSRIYYLPAGEENIRQLSHDDTHVGWLRRQGQLNEREARNHPRRNVLQKALGGGHQFVEPQVGAVGYQPGDTFLLCTDGLVDGLHDHHLVEILRGAHTPSHPAVVVPAAAPNPARQLVEESLALSGRDNTTALVIKIAG